VFTAATAAFSLAVMADDHEREEIMNQRLTYSEAAPAVYKAMLALQASVDKSGLDKDLMDLVCLRISYRKRTKVHRRNSLSGTVAFSHDQNCLALQISKRDHRCTHG
jgi:hypothetical protein